MLSARALRWVSTADRAVLSAAVAAGLVAVPALARAAEDFTVSAAVSLGGKTAFTYNTLTIAAGGMLTVLPPGSAGGTGDLIIVANTIVVQAGGAIVADGAGYAGVDGMAGGCSSQAMMMCAQAGLTMGLPGGGGGFVGSGANGTAESTPGTCQDLGSQSQGGLGFFSMTTLAPDLGSAGGASNLASAGTAGYAGGGHISLSAASITIDGTISANGFGSATHFGGVGPGGGSGGAIEILAASLLGTGTISVKGGQGAHGTGIPGSPAIPPNNGGGGSGGVVIFHLPENFANPVKVVATGGATGDCTTLPGPDGATAFKALPTSCVDLDGDMHPSIQCGGDDCDDTNPDIHPGQPEKCNGIDDNCSGKIDQGDICPPNEACIGTDAGTASCIPIAKDGGGASQLPDYIDFGGGCEVGSSGDDLALKGAGAFAVALVLVGARTRRQRRTSRA